MRAKHLLTILAASALLAFVCIVAGAVTDDARYMISAIAASLVALVAAGALWVRGPE